METKSCSNPKCGRECLPLYSIYCPDCGQKIANLNNNFGDLFVQGGKYYEKGLYANAVNCFTEILIKSPLFLEAYLKRGLAYSKIHDFNKAILDYDKVIELNQTHFIAFNNRGNAKFNLKMFSDAVIDYTRAIELYPHYALAFKNRGITYLKLGLLVEANRDFEEEKKLSLWNI